MRDIIETFGICQGEPCKRKGSQVITSEKDKVTIGKKDYHKGCEPTPKEQASKNKSYT